MGEENLKLLEVARREKWSVLEILLNSVGLFGFDLNRVDEEDGWGLIHILAEKNGELLEKLVSQTQKSDKFDINMEDSDGKTGLHVCVENGNVKGMRALVKAGADLNIKDESGETPLFGAIRAGELEAVQFLIEQGAFVLTTNGDGCTALHLSCESDDFVEITQLLLKVGVTKECVDNQGRTPLHVAVAAGSCRNTSTLFKEGHSFSNDLLHIALRSESNPNDMVVWLLKEARIDVNTKDHEGETALHIAARRGSPELARILVDAGARVDESDIDGYTPLHAAVGVPLTTSSRSDGVSLETLTLLLSHGASLAKTTHNGDTPIHLAASAGNWKDLGYLLSRLTRSEDRIGCLEPNRNGYTPSQLARENGHTKAIHLLEAFSCAISKSDQTTIRIRRSTVSKC